MKQSKKVFTVTIIHSDLVWGYFGRWGKDTLVTSISIEDFNNRKYTMRFNNF